MVQHRIRSLARQIAGHRRERLRLTGQARSVGARERGERRELNHLRHAAHPDGQRARARHWWTTHLGLTEQPYGANRDNRADGITAMERRLGSYLVGLAWCGDFLANGFLAAGVHGVSARQASVGLIEDDATAGRPPFRAWTHDARQARRGDAVVLFGRGIHVAAIDHVDLHTGVVHTFEGNTSFPGTAGSQSNGGCSTRRTRPLTDVHGFALVAYKD